MVVAARAAHNYSLFYKYAGQRWMVKWESETLGSSSISWRFNYWDLASEASYCNLFKNEKTQVFDEKLYFEKFLNWVVNGKKLLVQWKPRRWKRRHLALKNQTCKDWGCEYVIIPWVKMQFWILTTIHSQKIRQIEARSGSLSLNF